MKIIKREKNCFYKGENGGGGCSKRSDQIWEGHGPGQTLASEGLTEASEAGT